MKRLSCNSDSFGEGDQEKNMYGRGGKINGFLYDNFDDDDDDGRCGGDEDLFCSSSRAGAGGGGGEKKRRLGAEQVRALERSFEVENKLEPERKVTLAAELGLQPRQVAVWFQNRRARWKTKQLERDFAGLRGRYDQLKADYDSLHLDNQSLHAQIKVLKAKLGVKESFSTSVIKEEPGALEYENNPSSAAAADADEQPAELIYKDGSSESDSSAVLNDDNSPNSLVYNQNSQSLLGPLLGGQRLMKMEGYNGDAAAGDDDFLADDEPCSSFFADEQPPTLSWYCSGEWS